jgi:hypothetical protein
MYIGFVLLVLANGPVDSGAAVFGSEQECKEANASVLQAINEAKDKVLRFEMGCYRLDKMPKPGANA